MITLNEEQMGKILRRLLSRQSREMTRAGCPDEESLANYLSGALAEDTKSQLDNHLANCANCLDDLSAAHGAAHGEERAAVPQQILERAMTLVPSTPPAPNLFDLVVRVARDSLELVSTSGRLVSAPALVGIRGKGRLSDATILQVEKELEKIKVGVEVERLEGEFCQVTVSVKSQSGNVVDTIRLSLVAGGRERASYLARQGTAVFDRIAPGEYRLDISQAGRPIGSIWLRLMDEN